MHHAIKVAHHMLVHRIACSGPFSRSLPGARADLWLPLLGGPYLWGLDCGRLGHFALRPYQPCFQHLTHYFPPVRSSIVNTRSTWSRWGRHLGLEPAPLNYVSAVQSPFGNLGVAICLDAFYPELRERLSRLGADVFLQPSANNGPWNDWQQEDWLRSSFQAVADRKEFRLAVNPMLVGGLWDLKFEGQSSIIDHNGYVHRAQSHSEEEILLQKVPWS